MNSLLRVIPAPSDPRQNHLLAALPEAEWSRWLPHLERVDFPMGQVLGESSSPFAFVYFPTTAVISLLSTTVAGGTSEIAVVGCDGMVGVNVIMGGTMMLSRAVVQSAGQGFRLSSMLVRAEIDRAGSVLHFTYCCVTRNR